MNQNKRAIAHLDLDAFFVSCERLANSSLNNIPLIIGGKSDRAVVASCSYEARKYGVRSAMPMQYALRLCPQATVVKGDMELYSRKSKVVTDILKEDAPLVEKSSIDEFFLDLTGMDKYFGCYKWTNELTQKILKETGLPISFGLSINKTVSKIATSEGKPLGKMEIPAPQVRPFLNPLSIAKIPMVGQKTFESLSRLGIRKIHTLAEMPQEMMYKILGKNGIVLWKKAQGIDERAVIPYVERKSISSEQTFQQDTIDVEYLKGVLVGMVEKLAYQLRKENKCCSTVSVKIRYANFDTYPKQCKVSYTNLDHILIEKVKALFDKLYNKRMRIRLIGVKLDGLVNGGHQIDLFHDTSQNIKLYHALDAIKNKYGEKAVRKSVAL